MILSLNSHLLILICIQLKSCNHREAFSCVCMHDRSCNGVCYAIIIQNIVRFVILG